MSASIYTLNSASYRQQIITRFKKMLDQYPFEPTIGATIASEYATYVSNDGISNANKEALYGEMSVYTFAFCQRLYQLMLESKKFNKEDIYDAITYLPFDDVRRNLTKWAIEYEDTFVI